MISPPPSFRPTQIRSCSPFARVHPHASPTLQRVPTWRDHSVPPAPFCYRTSSGPADTGPSPSRDPGTLPPQTQESRPPAPPPSDPEIRASLTAAHSLFGPRQDAWGVDDTNALQDLIGELGAHEPGAEGRSGVSAGRGRRRGHIRREPRTAPRRIRFREGKNLEREKEDQDRE